MTSYKVETQSISILRLLSRGKVRLRSTKYARQALWIWSYVDVANRSNHYHDRLTVRAMKRVLKRDSVCIDAGANRGDILRHMVAFAPVQRHYAFEPVPALVNDLRREFPTLNVVQVALSDEEGSALFNYVPSSPGISGLDRNDERHAGADVEVIDVQTARLDEVVPPDVRVSFMKVDVEGGELRVFRGARRILMTDRPVVIWEQGRNPSLVYDELSGAGLAISTLRAWFKNPMPLDKDAFARANETEYMFIAYPAT